MKYSEIQAVANEQVATFSTFDLGKSRELFPFCRSPGSGFKIGALIVYLLLRTSLLK